MDIKKATEQYEAWLRTTLPVVIEADLDFKHRQMSATIFPFFRATFYRWAPRWLELCPHLASAPTVLGVGDLHVENYGTWRDREGRLIWGVNDLDEATDIPYPADLVRLATSAALAASDDRLSIRPKDASEALLAGYQDGLKHKGEPFVLAERHRMLRRVASGELRDPTRYWDRMNALPVADPAAYPSDALSTVVAALPETAGGPQASVRSRRAGLGSLGRPRLVAVADCEGGAVAREVKSLLPSAWDWATGRTGAALTSHYGDILARAVRCPDPFTAVHHRWLIRRLAPDCARIELVDLPAERDEATLLHAMGAELANVHLGTPGAGPAILQDLADRAQEHAGWLLAAAERMVADTQSDWANWRS